MLDSVLSFISAIVEGVCELVILIVFIYSQKLSMKYHYQNRFYHFLSGPSLILAIGVCLIISINVFHMVHF